MSTIENFGDMSYDKLDRLMRGNNINFLIGSGASSGKYPTLSFGDNFPSFEDIVSDKCLDNIAKCIMYVYYFNKCILPMGNDLINEKWDESEEARETIKNYRRFVEILYSFLQNESNELPKRINIFTTNYDCIIEKTFDEFLLQNPLVYFNDGSRGVFNKYISNQNFYLNVTHSGYNDNYRREVPTINLFKLHGSLSWKVTSDNETRILVDTDIKEISNINKKLEEDALSYDNVNTIIEKSKSKNIKEFVTNLNDEANKLKDYEEKLIEFYNNYSKLPIINPDKYKFSETVLEQHYYQQIRSFSYELEKKKTILIVFGFSFADEHIRDIFKRSLLNPELLVIIISYSKKGQDSLKDEFRGYRNIIFLPEKIDLYKGDFKYLLYLLGDKIGN